MTRLYSTGTGIYTVNTDIGREAGSSKQSLDEAGLKTPKVLEEIGISAVGSGLNELRHLLLQ